MRTPPFSIERIHLVGIGGIGMSGIAEILHHLGYKVQGSDVSDNYNVTRLKRLGINVIVGHHAENVSDVDVVVVSSAVNESNPEIQQARKLQVPVVKRAEMLAELMRLKWTISVGGSHGKTTTTSLVAMLLKQAECDPTVISGGILNSFGTNARLGKGDMMVVEADESDGSFQYLPSTMIVATNIDPEHMNYYGTLDTLKEAFVNFIEQIPFYGLGAVCGDDENVQSILPQLTNKRIVTYGFKESNNVQAKNVRLTAEGAYFDVEFHTPFKWSSVQNHQQIKDLKLSMVGAHNVLNALAVVCIAQEMGISDDVLRKTFEEFEGVKRRFTVTGIVNDVTFVDDYAHHPTEIRAVIKGALSIKKGRLFVIVQPHRYTRLKDHFLEFIDVFNEERGVDKIYITPVYAAGESPIDGYNSETLVSESSAKVVDIEHVSSEEALKMAILKTIQPNDMVVFMGAGNITQWAYDMPDLYKAVVV
jgi:UDP-N-acetylmuramate--alanine ligase